MPNKPKIMNSKLKVKPSIDNFSTMTLEHIMTYNEAKELLMEIEKLIGKCFIRI